MLHAQVPRVSGCSCVHATSAHRPCDRLGEYRGPRALRVGKNRGIKSALGSGGSSPLGKNAGRNQGVGIQGGREHRIGTLGFKRSSAAALKAGASLALRGELTFFIGRRGTSLVAGSSLSLLKELHCLERVDHGVQSAHSGACGHQQHHYAHCPHGGQAQAAGAVHLRGRDSGTADGGCVSACKQCSWCAPAGARSSGFLGARARQRPASVKPCPSLAAGGIIICRPQLGGIFAHLLPCAPSH